MKIPHTIRHVNVLTSFQSFDTFSCLLHLCFIYDHNGTSVLEYKAQLKGSFLSKIPINFRDRCFETTSLQSWVQATLVTTIMTSRGRTSSSSGCTIVSSVRRMLSIVFGFCFSSGCHFVNKILCDAHNQMNLYQS